MYIPYKMFSFQRLFSKSSIVSFTLFSIHKVLLPNNFVSSVFCLLPGGRWCCAHNVESCQTLANLSIYTISESALPQLSSIIYANRSTIHFYFLNLSLQILFWLLIFQPNVYKYILVNYTYFWITLYITNSLINLTHLCK